MVVGDIIKDREGGREGVRVCVECVCVCGVCRGVYGVDEGMYGMGWGGVCIRWENWLYIKLTCSPAPDLSLAGGKLAGML